MLNRVLLLLVAMLAVAAFAVAAVDEVEGTVANLPLDGKSGVNDILDALDARGKGLRDFTADVSLAETDALSGETSTLLGKVYFQGKGEGNTRIRINFDKKQIGDAKQPYRKEYILKDGRLIERDFKRKQEIDRQVLKPGQKTNLLKLGEGPFPLPIGQPRQEVLKTFEVKKVEPAKDDPAGTVHVQLIPKPGSQFARKFGSIDVWVDVKANFPRRIVTDNKRAKTTNTTDLGEIKINSGLDEKVFNTESVGGDWMVRTEQMEE